MNVGDTDYAPLFPYGYGLRYRDAGGRLGTLAEDDNASDVPALDGARVAGSTHLR